jgi:hypothetical protein
MFLLQNNFTEVLIGPVLIKEGDELLMVRQAPTNEICETGAEYAHRNGKALNHNFRPISRRLTLSIIAHDNTHYFTH